MTSFWSPRNLERLAKVKLFIVDVDGVLTCGRLFWIKGQGFTRFYHVKDGYGLLMLKNFGIQVALISAGDSEDLKERIQSLKIEHAYLGDHDKMKAYDDLLQKTGLSPEETLFVGDELFDLPVLKKVGFSASVPGAPTQVRDQVHYVTKAAGGFGAVRELVEGVLESQKLGPFA